MASVKSSVVTIVSYTLFSIVDFGKDMDMNQLKTTLTCKICLTDIIGIIFVPCGHLGEHSLYTSFVQLSDLSL